jgi:hypothetical protein
VLYQVDTAVYGVPKQNAYISLNLKKPRVLAVRSSRLMVLLEPLPFKMKAKHCFEAPGIINPMTKLYISEDLNLQLYRCGNLKCRPV